LGGLLLLDATSSTAARINDKGASSSMVAMWGVIRSGNAPLTIAAAKSAGSSIVL
jgi:hypothetical protein